MMSKPGPRRFQLQPLALPRLPRPTPHLHPGGPSAGLADTTCGDSQAAGCSTGRTDGAARSGLTAVAEHSAPCCLQGLSRRTPHLPLHPPCFTPLAVPPTRSARLWSKRNQEPVVRPGNRWQCYFGSCLVAGAGLQYSRAQPHQHRKKQGVRREEWLGTLKLPLPPNRNLWPTISRQRDELRE